MNRFYTLLINSITKSKRFSPHLLTAFSMSFTVLVMLWKGILAQPTLLSGIIVTGYRPNEILVTTLGFVAVLFGYDTYKQIKVGTEKP
jgi:hypothetical protein